MRVVLLSMVVCWAVFYSTLAIFKPESIVRYLIRSRMWSWYFRVMYNKTSDDLSRPSMRRNIRIQGLFSAVAAAILIFGLIYGS